jgi:3'(2'), 5'-bisphosphate nucleotidase
VTIADYGSQALITMALQRAFPGDSVVAEEESSLLRQEGTLVQKICGLLLTQGEAVDEGELLGRLEYGALSQPGPGRYWTLDPIDGTKGFLRKEQYAVALALIEHGVVVLGVLGCPNLPWNEGALRGSSGLIAYAVRGEGAFVESLAGGAAGPISVDGIDDPRRARLCEPVEEGHADQQRHRLISSALGMALPPIKMDSQCKYAVVARGEASIYLRLPKDASYEEMIWDHAAGSLIVVEAGGVVSDTRGAPLDFSGGRRLARNRGIVASNGRLHQRVLEAVAALPGSAIG